MFTILNIDFINAKAPRTNPCYDGSDASYDGSDPYSCTTPLSYYDNESVQCVAVIPPPVPVVTPPASDTESINSISCNELLWYKHNYYAALDRDDISDRVFHYNEYMDCIDRHPSSLEYKRRKWCRSGAARRCFIIPPIHGVKKPNLRRSKRIRRSPLKLNL